MRKILRLILTQVVGKYILSHFLECKKHSTLQENKMNKHFIVWLTCECGNDMDVSSFHSISIYDDVYLHIDHAYKNRTVCK